MKRRRTDYILTQISTERLAFDDSISQEPNIATICLYKARAVTVEIQLLSEGMSYLPWSDVLWRKSAHSSLRAASE